MNKTVDIRVSTRWLNAKLSGNEYHLLLLLSGFADDNFETIPVTQDAMGDLLGRSKSHVNQLVSSLIRKGVLEVAAKGNARAGEGTRYRLIA